MSPLGSDLKAAREAKGISLEEIAAATRINLRYLKALEADDFAEFPSDFFARSVIRAYARSVGLDEKEILTRMQPLGRETGSRAAGEAPRIPPAFKAVPPVVKNAAFFVFCAAAVGLTLFIFLKSRNNKPLPPTAAQETKVESAPAGQPQTTPPETTGSATAQPQATAQAVPPAPTAPSPAAAPAEIRGLRLELAFTAETWIQAFADGAAKLDGIRLAGATAVVEAEAEIILHLGNAGGVAVVLNGRPLKPFGGSGAVVKNIRMTPDNLADFWK
jgi:cytoskeletal protein RodZ